VTLSAPSFETFGTGLQQRPSGARPLSAPLHVTKIRVPLPVLLYLFTVVIPIGFQVGPLAMTPLRLMLLIVVIPLTAQLFMGRYGRVRATDILFLFYIAWLAFAVLVNNPDQVVEHVGSIGIEFIGGYVIGRAYIRSRESFAALCRVLALIVVCLLPLALFEAVTGRPIILEMIRKLPGMTSPTIHFMDPRMGLERVQMSFAHAIHWGLFCSVAFSLCFVGLHGIIGNRRRWIASILIAFSGFLALSSGALLSIALQFGLIAWAGIFYKVRYRWRILVGLSAVAYVVVDLLSNRTALDVFMSYATFSAHTAYWRKLIFQYGMDNVWANPFLGNGLNDWARPEWMYNSSVDNFWLVAAMVYGIPAFLFLVTGYTLAIMQIMRRDFSGDTIMTHMRRAWVFTFLGLSFTLCTVHIWTNIFSFVFFLFGAGMWMIGTEPQTSNRTKPETAPQPGRSPYTRFPAAGVQGTGPLPCQRV